MRTLAKAFRVLGPGGDCTTRAAGNSAAQSPSACGAVLSVFQYAAS